MSLKLNDEQRKLVEQNHNLIYSAMTKCGIRRQDFDDPTIRVLQRQLEKESDIKLLHYDNLLDDSRRLIGMSSY